MIKSLFNAILLISSLLVISSCVPSSNIIKSRKSSTEKGTSEKSITEKSTTEKSTVEVPELVMPLFPVDSKTATDNSGNVIQGLSSYGENWLVSQDAGNGYVLFNLLNSNGVSIGDWQHSLDSHGQDLSWDIDGTNIKIFTGNLSHNDAGITTYSLNLNSDKLSFVEHHDMISGFHSSTPTLNTNKNKFAVRASNISNSRDDRIYIYDRVNVDNYSHTEDSFFNLNSKQTVSQQYFQGIVFDGDKIYTLTGNGSKNVNKLIFTYDLSGNVLEEIVITQGRELGARDSSSGDWEPEGLTLKGDYLYYTINTGRAGARNKYLYRFKVKNRNKVNSQEASIEGYYLKHLGREADVAGMDYYKRLLSSKVITLSGVESSIRFSNKAQTRLVARIGSYYLIYLLRGPDAAGLNYYKNLVNSDALTLDLLEKILRESDSCLARCL